VFAASTGALLVGYKEIKSYFQEPQAVMVLGGSTALWSERSLQRNLRVSIQITDWV